MTTSWFAVAATTTPTPSPSVRTPDPDQVTPGTAGFLVIFLLALATLLLIRSMTAHLRKVRYSPDPAAQPPEGEPAAPPGGTGAGLAHEQPAGEPGPDGRSPDARP